MSWNVGQAKQHLSEVIRRAEKSPQLILNRAKPVAAVVSAADYERLVAEKRNRKPTIEQAVRELREAAAEEDYTLPTRPRTDRSNPLAPKKRRARR